MMRNNVVIIDSNEQEGRDFITGLKNATDENWELIIKKCNDRSSKFMNAVRYMKYAIVPLRIFLFRKHYDRIVAWQQFYGLFFAFYCRLFHVKKENMLLVMTFIYKEKKGYVGKLYKRFFDYVVKSKYIDGFTCVAKIECENYSKVFNEPLERFHYVQWGLRDFSKEYNTAPAKERYVFSAGRSNRDWDFTFSALGDAPFAAKFVCSEFKQRTYNNIEVFANIKDDEYYRILGGASCVFISTKNIGISAGQITLIQAMQFGKPVILTRSDGLTNDYVIDGYNGIVINKNKEELLGALTTLYSDKQLYDRLSRNGRRLYEEKYSNYRLGGDIGAIIRRIQKRI